MDVESNLAAGWEPPGDPNAGRSATCKALPVIRQFLENLRDAGVEDGLVLSRNSAGSYTVSDLHAAVAEWEAECATE